MCRFKLWSLAIYACECLWGCTYVCKVAMEAGCIHVTIVYMFPLSSINNSFRNFKGFQYVFKSIPGLTITRIYMCDECEI